MRIGKLILSTAAILLAYFDDASADKNAFTVNHLEMKMKSWENARAQGVFGGEAKYPSIHEHHVCSSGKVLEFQCDNVDLRGFLSHEALGSKAFAGNDIWGWTSQDGREFGIVGQWDGVAFVEVDYRGRLVYVGRLNSTTDEVSPWRDIKVIGDYAYIGAEAKDHGLQIFYLPWLLDIKPENGVTAFQPKVFDRESDITLFKGFGASHNIVAHESKNMIYAVGGLSGANSRNTTCAGGMFMVDVFTPERPASPGCIGREGYVHDAQCVHYSGPDKAFQSHEICFNFNEDRLVIMDMTDHFHPKTISTTDYFGSTYTHQGWLADRNMTILLLDDELDEVHDNGPADGNGRTTTYIFNVTDLSHPINTGFYQSPARSVDHNQYVDRGRSYQANYASGLRIVDITQITDGPGGSLLGEMGFFDCHPEDDAEGGSLEFLGAWSVFPFFRSGYILLNSIERGVFSLRFNRRP